MASQVLNISVDGETTTSLSRLCQGLITLTAEDEQPFTGLPPVCPCLVLGSPTLDLALQLCLTGAEQRGRITSLELLAVLLLMQPRRLVAFLATRARCWLVVDLLPTRIPRTFSGKLLSSQLATSVCWCVGLFLPRCRTWHLLLLNWPKPHPCMLRQFPYSSWANTDDLPPPIPAH